MSDAKLSICALALPFTDFLEDIEIAQKVGAHGLGLDEKKLADTDEGRAEQRRRFTASGLQATICAPAVLSILPRDPARDPGPRDPQQRIELIAMGIGKLAEFGADSVFCATGPAGEREAGDARRIVVEGLRHLAEVASRTGTRFALEPMRESFRPIWTMVNGLGETVDLLDAVGRDDLGIVFDTWHLWDSPDVRSLIPENAGRFVGVQIADYREPPRHIRDRVAAGDGVADIAGLVDEIRQAGFEGWYDMEVFSDLELEDSLWKLPPVEFARLQIEKFRACCA